MALGMANFGAAFFNGYPVTRRIFQNSSKQPGRAKTTMLSVISAILIY